MTLSRSLRIVRTSVARLAPPSRRLVVAAVVVTVVPLAGCASAGAPPASPAISNGGKCATVDWNRCTYLF